MSSLSECRLLKASLMKEDSLRASQMFILDTKEQRINRLMHELIQNPYGSHLVSQMIIIKTLTSKRNLLSAELDSAPEKSKPEIRERLTAVRSALKMTKESSFPTSKENVVLVKSILKRIKETVTTEKEFFEKFLGLLKTHMCHLI